MINDILLKTAVAAETAAHSAARRARREEGQSTLEWIMIAVALVIVAYGGYKILGNSIVQKIKDMLSGMGITVVQ